MEEVSALLRRVYPHVLAHVLTFTRRLPDAEDAVQEAIARALSSWNDGGMPESAEAWLVTVAKNAHKDRLRKGKWEQPSVDALEELAQRSPLKEMSPWAKIAVGDPGVARGWKDELLRLVFACCHPALEPGEAAALCLATIVGLSTRELAAAFVVDPRTIEQRLTRARQRLRAQGDHEGVAPEKSQNRMDAVLCVIHLLYNEGYWSTDDEAPIRGDLCRLSLGLGHSLLETFPREPEVMGLVALLSLHEARRPARQTKGGVPIPLPEQDRNLWDRDEIARAYRLLAEALTADRVGPLQVEAAISATHCSAASPEATDWAEISRLYAVLERLRPTPAVRVNRAFAVAKAEGPEAGLALLDQAPRYSYVHLVRGTLLAELGRAADAKTQLLLARDEARNEAERMQIDAMIAKLPRHT